MSHPVVAARIAQQEALIERARAWAADLSTRLPGLRAVTVFGSVARGDFNKWSDIDVLVIADGLPADYLARRDAVAPAPPGIEPVLWTPDELDAARARRNPIVRECDAVGVVVHGAMPAAPVT